MSEKKTVLFKIKRQPNPTVRPSWEEFELLWHSGMNVISSLMEIAVNPVTREGKATTPITYDSNCLEEVCGSCAMLINGRARMACSALVDKLEQPIRLEPFSKFPVVRDLAVDRSVLFENLKAVKAWVPIDGSYDLGSGPRMTMESRKRPILFRVASPAAVAWRRAPNPRPGSPRDRVRQLQGAVHAAESEHGERGALLDRRGVAVRQRRRVVDLPLPARLADGGFAARPARGLLRLAVRASHARRRRHLGEDQSRPDGMSARRRRAPAANRSRAMPPAKRSTARCIRSANRPCRRA